MDNVSPKGKIWNTEKRRKTFRKILDVYEHKFTNNLALCPVLQYLQPTVLSCGEMHIKLQKSAPKPNIDSLKLSTQRY